MEEEEEEDRFPNVLVPFFSSSITLSDHLPTRFTTYWRALFQSLMQNWQVSFTRAKRLQVTGVILAKPNGTMLTGTSNV